MSLHKFALSYIDLDPILWVKKFTAELLPANVVRQENVGGVRIGIGNNEITLYEDEPLKALDLNPDQVLHVAGSATDTLGAKSAGLRCAWSNRFGDLVLDPKYKPDYEFKDLTGLLDLI
jgi:hypothetical protein